MISIGLHSNYWNGIVADMNPRRILDLTVQTGARALDFPTTLALNMTKKERRLFACSARERSIRLTLNGGIANADVSHPLEEVRESGIASCKGAIEAAADLGCDVWSGVIYARWLGMPDGPLTVQSKADMWERAVNSLRTLCTFADSLGVNIAIEIVNRFEAFLINTTADGLRFASDVGHARLKLLLDIFHMNIEEDCASDALAEAIRQGRLGHMHISESNRRLPGLKKSDICWDKTLSAIKNANYDGSVILESMVLSQAPAAYSFRTWRDIADEPNEPGLLRDAKTSLAFVRALLKA